MTWLCITYPKKGVTFNKPPSGGLLNVTVVIVVIVVIVCDHRVTAQCLLHIWVENWQIVIHT